MIRGDPDAATAVGKDVEGLGCLVNYVLETLWRHQRVIVEAYSKENQEMKRRS